MEILNKRNASLVLVAALGLSAIGMEAASTPEPSITTNQDPKIGVEFYPDGTRMVHLGGIAISNLRTHSMFADVYEACAGKDLVKDVIGYRPDLTKGGPTVSVNDPACATGELTPSDFLSAN